MNSVYKAIVEAQLRAFKREFAETAWDVYYSEERGSLIHPGEFGMHREAVVRSLLAHSLAESFGIAQGFVLSPSGGISTQCDIVVYDKRFTPIIKNSEEQRFFPVESVVAVGEVKSQIWNGQLGEACKKLADVKRLRGSLTNPAQVNGNTSTVPPYSTSRFVTDGICTFIVAAKLELPEDRISEEIAGGLGGDDPESGVNLVLDVEGDRCITYKDDSGNPWPYPVDACRKTRLVRRQSLKLHFEGGSGENLAHLKLFLYYLQLTITRANVLFPDLRGYWGWG